MRGRRRGPSLVDESGDVLVALHGEVQEELEGAVWEGEGQGTANRRQETGWGTL